MSAPSGSVAGTPTFLFSDIEGSTRLLRTVGDRYGDLLDEHRRIVAGAVEAAGGRVFGTEGDGVFSAFATPGAAIAAAVAAQRGLGSHEWPADAPVRVRMGIHTGEALLRDGDYVGLAVHEAARVMSAGHGGQVLVTEATRRLASNLPPGVELRDLGERRLKDLAAPGRLYQVVAEGLAESFAPLHTLDARPHNLPVQLTSFVGRAELAAARAALAETRLLTLSGPGGTGKTRLALQLAADVSDEFADGVFFVPLDAIADPRLVPSAIASALGLSVGGQTAPLDAVREFVRDKQLLLLLDNFEQVVDAAPDVGRLLREAAQVKVVVTTRVVLRIYGEREFAVPPLGLPPEDARSATAAEAMDYEAVELFVERARAVQPTFALTDRSVAQVVEIVRRLDGLPLAIELAAARTRTLPVGAIHARLDQHLSLLTGGARDLPGRQQTLRGAIDWSYELLAPADRRLFERFSVHSGGAFLAEADAVCGPASVLGEDVLDGLTSLADKSLVKPDLAAADEPRFAMLVTIRAYAHERLEAGPDFAQLTRRHAEVYLDVVESLSTALTGPSARELSDRVEKDHDNIRAALDWACANHEAAMAMRYIAAVWRFWQRRGHLAEARRRVDTVMGMPEAAAQPDALQARAYGAAGSVTYWQGDVHASYRYYGKALEAARRSGDKALIAEALYNRGFAAVDQEAPNAQLYAAGKPYWDEALALYRELGDPGGIADASWGLAQALSGLGDLDGAIRHGEEALRRYRELNDSFRIGWGTYLLAGLHAAARNWSTVEEHLRESLQVFLEANDRSGILLNLAGFYHVARARRERVRELRLSGATVALRAATGTGLIDSPIEMMDFVMPVRPVADAAALAEWDEGARMSAEEAATYALSGVDADKPEVSAG